MTVWRSSIERDAFVETHCLTCCQPDQAQKRTLGTGDGCPFLALGDRGRLPVQWKRRRNATMGDTYRCSEEVRKPAVNRRGSTTVDTEPLFDEPTRTYVALIPVQGWPDYRAQERKPEAGHS